MRPVRVSLERQTQMLCVSVYKNEDKIDSDQSIDSVPYAATLNGHLGNAVG